MKKNNQRGFVLVEAIVVAVFVLSLFTFLFVNVVPLVGMYERRLNYDTIDGVYNACRRLYILTTNQLTLNDNLLGRPGRIRYRFEFSNLLPEAIEEYLKDNLRSDLMDQKEKKWQRLRHVLM